MLSPTDMPDIPRAREQALLSIAATHVPPWRGVGT